MFYIRKLSKKSNLFKIRDAASNSNIEADVLKQELGTTRNTLSFWRCEDITDLKNAMKAILLSTTSIETSQFIIVNDEMLDKCGIERDYEEKGITGYSGYENLHVNLCNLDYGKIGAILNIIKEISEDKAYIPELKREDVKRYIIEVKRDGLLNEENIRPELKAAIDKYCPLTV